jgi:hypothetical protein
MKGLARLICLMALFGVTACQGVVPTSRATDSTDANPTSTSTGVESSAKSKSVDLGYSQDPEPKVTVSFNPVAIVRNFGRGLEQLASSDAANRSRDTVQSIAKEKAEAIERAVDSAKQMEQEPDRFRGTDNSIPPTDQSYTYHSAQPDPNLPPVEAISCNDRRVVSNPKQVCQVSPGVIRMPRLDK